MLEMAILAGGLATRLGSLTEVVPKSLLEIQHRPFIDWQLRLLSRSGIEKVVICLGHKSEMIQDFVGDGSRYGIKVVYSFDGSTQLGTGGAIRKALPLLSDEFMVMYGDSYLPTDFKAIETAFRSTGKPALMTVFYNKGSFDASNVLFVNGELEKYSKADPLPDMSHIDYGVSTFKRSVFESYAQGAPIDLSNICQDLSNSGSLAGYEVHERFYEIGSLGGINDFREYVERNGNVI
jgi:MurNAc alpha-1-phosphate uridylyltransferase